MHNEGWYNKMYKELHDKKENGMSVFEQIQMADSKTLNSYEYAIESISNTFSGKTQKEEMLDVIKKYAQDGWRVHTIYSNELGRNVVAFMGVGVNATQSEDIIIFERHIQYNVMCHTEKDLLVTNYCGDLPVRFGIAKMKIPQNSDTFFLTVAGKSGNDIKMEAFRVNAEFITIFDEKIPVNNISFMVRNTEKSNFVTEPYEVLLNKNEIKLIKAVKFYIKSYVVNGKAHLLENLNYVDVCDDLSITQKDIFGQDYFQEYLENENGWTCVCGKTNESETEICPICGRKRINLKTNKLLDLSKIMQETENKKSAKEIYDWLVSYNENSCNEVVAKIIDELNSVVAIERFYGNEKKSAINIIKQYLNEGINE